MEIPLDAFQRFIFQERSTIEFIEIDDAVHDAYYVVCAKICGIVNTSPYGIDVVVADHTGKSLFALRDIPAGDFFDRHMYQYALDEPIVDPYALDDEWEQTYLFKISKGQQTTFLDRTAYIVNDICMLSPVVEQFQAYTMSPQEINVYRAAISAVPRRAFPTRIGLHDIRDFSVLHPNAHTGFNKRIYLSFQP